jgi:hypothetical protein
MLPAMKARTLALSLAALAAVVFAGAWLGSPWLAAQDLMRAARERDAAAVEAHVDLPAVRASLKRQLGDRIEHSLEKGAARNEPMAQLGLLIAPALVDKAIDAMVTPDTLAEIVRTARGPDPRKSAPPPGDPADAPKSQRIKASLALTGVNRFDIRLSPEDEPKTRLTLIMRRHGLFDWKVTDVELPD